MYHTREASDHKVTHTFLNGGGLYRPVHVKTLHSQKLRMLQKRQIGKVLSRFSSESASRPFHHGVRGRGGKLGIINYADRNS